jgi:hypothetical protein
MARVKPGSKPSKKASKKSSSIKNKKKKKLRVAEEEKAIKKAKRVIEDIDIDEDEDDVEEASPVIDRDSLDAGPSIDEVPFGHNCASCALFVKWDDPRRDDAEWLEKIEGMKKRCPKLFGPDEYETDDPQEVVAQADDDACEKFDLNEKKAPSHFVEALESVKRGFNIPELQVLFAISDKLLKGKELEQNMGYRYGQVVPVMIEGKETKARVVDFVKKKGREVIVRGTTHDGKTFKAAIPAVRAVEIEV